MVYDVAIIGAGVIGSMIARELSFYDVSVCVIEAAADIAAGASRANSGIVHAGYDAVPGTMKAKMNAEGNMLMEKTAKELGVPYSNCGSLVVAFSKEDDMRIKALQSRGLENGVPTKILAPLEIKQMEPVLSDKITSALYAKTAGIICPFSLTVAAVENAVENGTKVYLNSRVIDISRQDDTYVVDAGQNRIKARFIVNAAGLYADDISKMAGGETFDIRPRKGEYIIFDTSMKARVNTVIFRAPTEKGKGVLFTPTVYGNMLTGPTAEDIDDKANTSTSREGLLEVINGAKEYVPSIEKKHAITVFAGLRAAPSTHDFIIECSKSAKNLVNVAGIESPGLTSSPAIAKYVAQLLCSIGLEEVKKSDAKRTRQPIEVFAFATPERKKELIQQDARYANVVCRCEHVTEAQIVQSIHRPCGATTVDGVKFRTGAGMGRCHGGFCLPRVMRILARELGRDYNEITKSGDGAYILAQKTKEVGI